MKSFRQNKIFNALGFLLLGIGILIAYGQTKNVPPASKKRLSQAEQAQSFVDQQNVPIAFYALVIDENGAPLPGVTIQVSIRQWYQFGFGELASRHPKKELVTNPDGRVELMGMRGDGLQIESVVKAGYIRSPKTELGYTYAAPVFFKPDVNNPVVIRMWKQVKAETLITHRLSGYGVPCDGTPAQFDLIAGTKTNAGGHLKVTLVRSPVVLRSIEEIRSHYDWEATFEALEGGIQEAKDDFLFLAPESGYRKSVSYKFSANDKNWFAILERGFYLSLSNGRIYGRANVSFNTSYREARTGITMDIAVNPAGSRNLQR